MASSVQLPADRPMQICNGLNGKPRETGNERESRGSSFTTRRILPRGRKTHRTLVFSEDAAAGSLTFLDILNQPRPPFDFWEKLWQDNGSLGSLAFTVALPSISRWIVFLERERENTPPLFKVGKRIQIFKIKSGVDALAPSAGGRESMAYAFKFRHTSRENNSGI